MQVREERTVIDSFHPIECRITLVGDPAEFEKLESGIKVHLDGNRHQEELFAAIHRAAQPV